MLFLISLSLVSGNQTEKKIEDSLPTIPPSWWYEKTENEKWLYFRQAMIEAREYQKAYEDQKELTKKPKEHLRKTTKYLEKHKNFYPKWGFSISPFFCVDKTKTFDFSIRSDFYIILAKRFMIIPGFEFQILNDFGGGASIGFGCFF